VTKAAPTLSGRHKRYLRGLAHSLKPVIQLGKEGMTDKLIMAVDDALFHHELLKVKVLEGAPESRKDVAPRLAESLGAELVGLVGRMVILYRAHPEEPRIELPKG